jgi:hypothetical protein
MSIREPTPSAGTVNSAALAPADTGPGIAIRLLGAFEVVINGQAVAADDWRLRRARAVVKLLALTPGYRLERDQLTDLLWPDLDPPTVPGRIINCPLPPGSGGDAFRRVVTEQWAPALERFRPQLLLVSAGFDAHAADDMAHLRLGAADYGWVTDVVCAVAARHAEGRVVSTLEGGYDLPALATSAATHIERLMLA